MATCRPTQIMLYVLHSKAMQWAPRYRSNIRQSKFNNNKKDKRRQYQIFCQYSTIYRLYRLSNIRYNLRWIFNRSLTDIFNNLHKAKAANAMHSQTWDFPTMEVFHNLQYSFLYYCLMPPLPYSNPRPERLGIQKIQMTWPTFSIKIIEWPRKIHGHGAAKEIPCPMKESSWFYCHSIFLGESRDMY